MANVAKHLFVSAKSDGADATLVQPGDWNDYHTFAGGASDDDILAWKAADADKVNWRTFRQIANNIVTTKGDILARSATQLERFSVGTDGQALVADSTQTLGLAWGSAGLSLGNALALMGAAPFR